MLLESGPLLHVMTICYRQTFIDVQFVILSAAQHARYLLIHNRSHAQFESTPYNTEDPQARDKD